MLRGELQTARSVIEEKEKLIEELSAVERFPGEMTRERFYTADCTESMERLESTEMDMTLGDLSVMNLTGIKSQPAESLEVK